MNQEQLLLLNKAKDSIKAAKILLDNQLTDFATEAGLLCHVLYSRGFFTQRRINLF